MAKGIITTKYLEELGVDKETAQKIFAERGREVEEMNAEKAALEEELKECKENFEKLTSELESLKADNASGEEWKEKFEKLQSDIEAEKKKADEERALQEKNANIQAMFENAVKAYGKTMEDWGSPVIQSGYKNLFISEIEKPENVGKAHKDILHELTKNDKTAWKGVEVMKLPGGTGRVTGGNAPTKEEFKKMSYAKKLELFNTNKELYDELNKE